MAHDYAKKTRSSAKAKPRTSAKRTRKSAPPPPATSVPGWLWLVVGIAMGAFVMFLVRLADVDASDPTPPVRVAKPQPAKEAKPEVKKAAPAPVEQKTAAPAKVEPQKPRFDFYKMLEENEVPVVAELGELGQVSAKPERTFLLQVASFRKAEDAEQLRVELLLLNLDARTEEVTVRNGEVWHRVLTGPFESRSMLAKARSTLISNGHQALVMEYKKPTEG
ncbi:MAG TPA: SPOR domain-containing protein [Marinagarivorans sp.]